jgi:AmiR/NasT family two-component response regulator
MDKTRVLLADDHAIVRAGIGKALGELDGLEIVEEVGDGPSLFDALARLRPDLLVMTLTWLDCSTQAWMAIISKINRSAICVWPCSASWRVSVGYPARWSTSFFIPASTRPRCLF